MSSPSVVTDSAPALPSVLELPGLYGPFTFPEKLLQKIWLRRSFDERRAVTVDGRQVDVIHGGKWNLMGGPDFKNARVRLGNGTEISGDIEIHIHAADWLAHRHARDPAYDRVILHVVLFAPAPDHVTKGAGDAEIPVLVLLPLLHHDLEEYAAEDAVEQLANRPASQIIELLGKLSLAELRGLLRQHADQRWAQKVHYARLRINRLGWHEACHQTALEILGYRFNRAPMLRIATALPLAAWREESLDVGSVYQSETTWSLQGLRPANHPRLRLTQYAAWVRAWPDWPSEISKIGANLPALESDAMTSDVRRTERFTELRRSWNESVVAGSVGGTRFDNLLCDGVFPLLGAALRESHPFWFHWFVGDVPPLWRRALRDLEVFAGRNSPACHGMIQGLLGWLIERERMVASSTGHRA